MADADRYLAMTRLLIGAMSGTSADGVDAALVRIGGTGLSMTAGLLHQARLQYDADLRKTIFKMRAAGSVELVALARLGRDITLVYAQAVNELLAVAKVSP